jgi:XamI restriction endonuclease
MKPAIPPRWTDEQFEADRQIAIATFREHRMREPLEQYLEAFATARNVVTTLLEDTANLTALLDKAADVLSDADLLPAVRYLSGPPISADDLKTLAVDASLAPSLIRADPGMARRIIQVVLLGLDRQRFPWLAGNREPSEAERQAAVTATAALLAQRLVMTSRANESKEEQEQAVKDRLRAEGFTEVGRRTVRNMSDAPGTGTFCAESQFGSGKADIVVRLYDGRVMPTEAKVSNSSTNSVKRLNRDAAAKAYQWTQEFGPRNVVPAAVLAGVFKTHNLRSAQDQDNLTIFWAHNLDAMVQFIDSTKPGLF